MHHTSACVKLVSTTHHDALHPSWPVHCAAIASLMHPCHCDMACTAVRVQHCNMAVGMLLAGGFLWPAAVYQVSHASATTKFLSLTISYEYP